MRITVQHNNNGPVNVNIAKILASTHMKLRKSGIARYIHTWISILIIHFIIHTKIMMILILWVCIVSIKKII